MYSVCNVCSVFHWLLYSLTNYCHVLQVEEIDLPDLSDAAVPILTVSSDTDSLVKFGHAIHSIVLEGAIVECDITELTDALILLFALIYALHVDYPKQLSYAFNFIQKL